MYALIVPLVTTKTLQAKLLVKPVGQEDGKTLQANLLVKPVFQVHPITNKGVRLHVNLVAQANMREKQQLMNVNSVKNTTIQTYRAP